ncbi:hemerythrin domain-containing protein [Oryzobacter terrae]|uniref:hemerythrin domain-containing protein n=1 Tax=Oryzobacter terrae TaxID=1620385 RepID=UPI00366E8715
MTARPAAAPSRRQLDLPGQTHVAEGPHDHTGMYVMHHAFRRDLAAFAASVRATPLTDVPTWQALARRWDRFASCLHHHHTAEDELYWPALLRAAEARGTGADLVEVRAMSEEHADIDPLVEACISGFAAVVDHPCEEHRNALDIRVAGLREVLGEHLRHEETVVLPLVQRVMTTEEFTAVEAAIGRSYPLRETAFLIGWAMSGLPPQGREAMVALAGTPYRVLHALVRGRFERGERAAFRHGGGGTL